MRLARKPHVRKVHAVDPAEAYHFLDLFWPQIMEVRCFIEIDHGTMARKIITC